MGSIYSPMGVYTNLYPINLYLWWDKCVLKYIYYIYMPTYDLWWGYHQTNITWWGAIPLCLPPCRALDTVDILQRRQGPQQHIVQTIAPQDGDLMAFVPRKLLFLGDFPLWEHHRTIGGFSSHVWLPEGSENGMAPMQRPWHLYKC
jgi:hypothetical protein